MLFQRILVPAALLLCLSSAVVALPATALAASPSPGLPQAGSARTGATWLADQLNSDGYIPSPSQPGSPDLSATANAILALASASVDPTGASKALTYMAAHVNAYVRQDGSDGPGQLALLILDAHALGASPTSFGHSDLVSRLLATEQTSGVNKGLFGTISQVDDYLAGDYDQGLALSALAGVGIKGGSDVTAAESWLHAQQCPDGGWTSYEEADNPCDGSPADYEGPDTNSTSLAIQGLSAEDDLGTTDATKALDFLSNAQDSDGGWGYEPNAADAPGSTDPDSTALVIQAILALGQEPTNAMFEHNADPVSVLESFQLTSGTGKGAFTYPGISGPNTLATYQAVPAVAGVIFPFNLFVTTTSLPKGAVDESYHVKLAASGGNPPYTWSVENGFGTLPKGLTLDPSTGVISGKPQDSGTSTFVIKVTDTDSGSPSHHNLGWRFLSITT